MKKVICSLLTAIALLVPTTTKADNVSVDQAKDVAAHFLQHNSTLARITADQLTLTHQWNNEALGVPSMYLLSAPAEGWVIVAATTVMDPIVGYADDNVLDPDNMAPQLEWWLEEYNKLVVAFQTVDAEHSLENSNEWKTLEGHGLVGTKASNYLMDSEWDQGGIRGTDYNIFCPEVNDTVCPVGCVATALAQICYYYGYPKSPKGSINYTWRTGGRRLAIRFDTVAPLDYSLMPNKIRTSSTRAQREEVSRLGYYLGLGVHMEYGADGSGASSEDVASAMNRYFKYSTGTYIRRRQIDDTAFLNGLKRDLASNRPVYMSGKSSTGSGRDAAGHAWVCDGLNSNGRFHMNWGWGGGGNGFFRLAENDMAISQYGYNFNDYYAGGYQTIIVGMVPPQDSTDRFVGVPTVDEVATLGHPYPNPATWSVVIPYSTREAADLQVYAVNGQLVETRRIEAGDGEVTLRVDALPAGIYVYRMGAAYGKFVVR